MTVVMLAITKAAASTWIHAGSPRTRKMGTVMSTEMTRAVATTRAATGFPPGPRENDPGDCRQTEYDGGDEDPHDRGSQGFDGNRSTSFPGSRCGKSNVAATPAGDGPRISPAPSRPAITRPTLFLTVSRGPVVVFVTTHLGQPGSGQQVLDLRFGVERAKGIEPSPRAWEALSGPCRRAVTQFRGHSK
jgi:hypothetical protein